MLILLYFLLFLIQRNFGMYTLIKSKSNNVTFRYMDGVNGESDIHVCGDHEVCNVIHDRFWMPKLAERLCSCPNKKECQWEYESRHDNLSIPLNNRSVLKFCAPVTELNECTHKDEAATVFGEGDMMNSYIMPHNVTIDCICPESHYWRLQKYIYEVNNIVMQTYKCVKKRMCDTGEFCGHIRSDLFSTYYRCTCPENHLCIFKNRTQENVQELLYSGPAYRAYCYPFKPL